MDKFNFVHFNKYINYPVATNIRSNIGVCYEMAEMLNNMFPDQTKRVALWCRGSSGAIIAGLITTALNHFDVIINHVKKDGETSHSTNSLYKGYDINIVVDDLIETGETINSITNFMVDHEQNPLSYDCLIISGSFRLDRLKLIPKNIICNSIHNTNYDNFNDDGNYIFDRSKLGSSYGQGQIVKDINYNTVDIDVTF